jgi:hypothetical protein
MGDSFTALPRVCAGEGCVQIVVFFIDAQSVRSRHGERSRTHCRWCGNVNVLLDDGTHFADEASAPPASTA